MISTQTAGDTLFIRVNGPITSQSEEALWQIGKAQHVVVIIDSCGGNAEALSSLVGALLAHDDTPKPHNQCRLLRRRLSCAELSDLHGSPYGKNYVSPSELGLHWNRR